jgi:serine/threonine protein kinase
VLKVLEPLEETHGQMVFVSEPLFGSLADMLCRFASVPSAPPERAAAELSPLERRYGLTQLADALTFLHSEARLAHRGLCPSAILITRDGAWRLAGFEHSAPIAEFGSADGGAAAAGATMGAGAVGVPSSMGAGGGGGGWSGGGVYEYSSASPSPWEEYCLVRSSKPTAAAAARAFL